MSSLSRLAAMGFAVLMSACAASAEGPPEIQVDRSACAHCTMLVSEPRYAAAYQMDGAAPKTFDDIGCLLDALLEEGRNPARVWFMDAQHGFWIEGSSAVFLLSEEIRTPMGGGVTAYRDASAAHNAAARHKGRIVNAFEELRAAWRER